MDKILDVSRDLVLSEGARSVTVDRIVTASGAPKGSVYHRFSSVNDLLATMWLRGVRRSQARFLEPLDADADPIPSAVAAGSEHQAVPLRIRSFDEAVERLGEERVVQVIEEHGDHSGLPAGEAPRHRVRRVPQLLGRRPHPLATLGADVRAVAHDERDERP